MKFTDKKSIGYIIFIAAILAYPALADFLQQPVDAPPPDPDPSTQLRQLLDDVPE